MNPEQIVREIIAAIDAHEIDRAMDYTTTDFVVRDQVLKNEASRQVFFSQMQHTLQAFPDWHYDLHQVSARDDQVTVTLDAVATHTQPWQLFPGMPPIPATGKHVVVPDRFIFSVRDGKVAVLTVDSPPGGGAMEMLRQVGIQLPSR